MSNAIDVYQVAANRTAAPPDFNMTQRLETVVPCLIASLKTLQVECELIDQIKKFVFYGRPLRDSVAEHCKTVANNSGLGCSVPAPNVENMRALHGLIGIVSEAPEIAEILVRLLEGVTTVKEERVNIVEELGDVLWYAAESSTGVEVPLNFVAITNVNKLATRYKKTGEFDDGDAIYRDLMSELYTLTESVEDADNADQPQTPSPVSPQPEDSRDGSDEMADDLSQL